MDEFLPMLQDYLTCMLLPEQLLFSLLSRCGGRKDTMAQEDHVQRQEQARGCSRAEFCHYSGGCEKHYEGHASQIWP